MILGVGTDIVEIAHFKKVWKKTPTILERLFTPNELARSLSLAKKEAYYAKRFAAKEALSKAFGTGICSEIGWQDIEISNDKKGTPVVALSPKACRFLQKKFKIKKPHIYLSLTDEKKYAMAFSVFTD